MPGRAVGMAAALVVGLLLGFSAYADDSKKQERRIGEAAADRELFVGKLAVFDAKQIALGELALERSQDPQVRKLAKQLVVDHRKHLSDLRNWADTQALQVAAVDLSGPSETGVGGSGNEGIREGYDERREESAERLDEAIDDAREDVTEVKEKQGEDFDKAFISRVVDDQKDGQKLVRDGLDTYRADATFSLLLNRTGNVIERNLERGKSVEKAID
ncbi:DUF4142 domain-containing protein [Pyxidicoccus sp. 3LG]